MIEALGRYELLRMLGRGGMAEVYLARRRVAGLEKRLVVKRIRRERAGDPAILDLFMREAKLSMSLGHQNVVPVFDFGRIGDDAFLAMEYVDGRDLGSTLARAARPLPPLLAAYIASECCRALDHAHHRRAPDGGAAGVIHRDVTPRNVLLSWAGEVKLTDFGVATLATDGDDQIRGTWAYMAPEQARGEAIDGRADLYGLGLVLWGMLAGARPRSGDDPASLRERARSGELPPPPAGPPSLVAVVVRATERERESRFADAHDMQNALDAYLIAARAETPGLAPERQLAAWLTEVWGEEVRRAELADDYGDALTVDSPGDRTQRSVAATMADAAEGGAAGAGAAGDAVVGSDPMLAAGSGEAAPAPSPATAVNRRRSRRVVVALGGIAAATAALALAVTRPWTTSAGSGPAPAPPAATTAIPPTSPATSPPPSRTPKRATNAGAPAPTGEPSAPEPGPVATAGLPRRRPATATATMPGTPTTPTSPTTPGAPAPTTNSATPPPALRQVTIGATPWADFTVDDDPTPHQTPETLELRPGRHRIHLRNPTIGVERTITLDVPTDRDLRHVEKLEP